MAWWNPFTWRKKPTEPPFAPLPSPAQLLADIPDNEKGHQLAQHIRWAEEAYDEMYEGRSPSGAYANMKDSLIDAIRLAEELGLTEKRAQLERLLEHRQSVFRRQMS